MQPISAAEEPLLLRQEDCRLSLDPAHGGAVREFSWRGRPVFRPTPCDAVSDPFAFSCFPMVPYANRIAGGRFSFRNHVVEIAANRRGDIHPLHGEAWLAPWTVLSASSFHATLAFEGGGDTWPWRYLCEQRFDLRSDGLTVALSVENLSGEPMPAMLGLHPYFPDARKARLAARLPKVWLTENNLAAVEVAAPPGWRFDRSQRVAVALDHSFSGWDGTGEIAWPNHKLRIRATNCSCLHLYTPAGEDFFCVEPQTAAAGALNRNGSELTILEPGARLVVQIDFAIGEV
jgi:aldose 1-epimerase